LLKRNFYNSRPTDINRDNEKNENIYIDNKFNIKFKKNSI